MKTVNKYILASAIAACSTAGAFAQASYSGYFLENYTHRYQLNPAMADTDRNNFVAMPALGNLNIGMHGNLGVKSVLYNVNGKTVLFTNPDVAASTVLSNIHDKNKIGFGTNIDILAAGFKAFGGMNAVTISAVADGNIMLPGSIFRLAKEGVSNKTYDISDIRANANGYASIQFNHSRDIKQLPGLRVGAAMKFLIGLASVDAKFNQAQLTLGEDNWNVRANADLTANIKGASFQHDHNKHTGREYVSGLELDGFGPNGFGIGFDLGATYKWRDFEFSLALLDLGFISWSNTISASTNGTIDVNTNDYVFGVEKGEADDEWHRLTDNIAEIYQLTDNGNTGGSTHALNATLNWGVNYTLPYYRNLTFGLVNTTKFYGPMTFTDFRISANVRPVKCFSASANLAMGTYGVGFGWLANVNVKGFNFFVGMDRTLGKLAKQGIPLNSNAEVSLGMNFPF